ncbi:PspC domain-containing protein [Pedobacter heparinus]|uniref:PspC domain-containing protein n=1 Tax=Pedobacter heparinus TaxID=984 RepID=UPI00292F8936|nr:PspC domain-containing protein [Pedobacter heparinus]
MEKRLFRNEHDKVIAGVSSGVAEYMEVDVTIIRLLFVLSTIFLVGTGILVYLIMWIVVPVNNDPAARFSKFNDFFNTQQKPFEASNPFEPKTTESKGPYQNWTSSTVNDAGLGNESFESWKKAGDFKPYKKSSNETGRTVAGLFLLVIGMYFLMDEFNLIPFGFQLTKLWPLVFVAIGASFIIKSKNKSAWEQWKQQNMQEPVEPENAPAEPIVPESPDAPAGQTGSGIDFTKKEI